MKLLNASTLKIHEFVGDKIPPYAILSHRWEEEEVTFQDLQDGRGSAMQGWGNITGCCKQAIEDGFEYTWVDSCCIDKSSSAELSEAINSMFRWYEDSQVCYVYLSDVPPGETICNDLDSAFYRSQRIAIPKDPLDCALVMFKNTKLGSTETFILGIQGFWHNCTPSIALENPTRDELWEGRYRRLSECVHDNRLTVHRFSGDRTSARLGSERFVIAELRKKVRDGQPLYVVELRSKLRTRIKTSRSQGYRRQALLQEGQKQ